MPVPISSIHGSVPLTEALKPASPSSQPAGFSSLLEGAIQGLEQTRNQANQAVSDLLTGEKGELHTAALATQKAELAFDLGLQVRNKIVSAYQEVMRMQL